VVPAREANTEGDPDTELYANCEQGVCKPGLPLASEVENVASRARVPNDTITVAQVRSNHWIPK
jgi:hypothetical protein